MMEGNLVFKPYIKEWNELTVRDAFREQDSLAYRIISLIM